ncbi:zinc finger MYM-type protein 4-like [Actinia tenebrosa]|uniref:Zinc finger MYM-type protein 4-like n=1 Tax=Actinia tenebrosa TaxID=6105 RepID=A0A6P8J0S1_ACTTE|nr:zinc finger MYM-type protein 4-like [Actinia tenebrosa]
MPPKRQFRPPKSEEEERTTLEDCIPKSTRSSTKWAFKVFSEWQIYRVNKDPCKEQSSFEIDIGKVQSLETNIANMNAETLNFWLTKFVQEVVKVNGERYPGRSLYMIVAGLQRHLAESGNAISLLSQNDRRLNIFRRALDAEMRQATQHGVGIQSKMAEREEITEEDEAAFWKMGLLGCHSANSLLKTIYFYNGKLFGLRSNEHRNLRCSNFRIDSESVTYDESVSKTYHGGLKDLKYKPRVVKHVCCAGKDANHQPCLVNCFATYMEKIKHLAKNIDAFYFKPNANTQDNTFCRSPVGINTLNKILPNLCEEAGMERKTSHCLRITCASRLFQNQVDEKLIRDRTGHRSNALLKYEKSSLQQETVVSNLLGPPLANLTDNSSTVATSTKTSSSETNVSCSKVLEDIESLDFEVADELLGNMVLPDTSNAANVVISGSIFNNCTFHLSK